MCGLVHSILVTVPVNVTGRFESNSAEIEWCAPAGATIASAMNPATTNLFMSILLGVRLPELDRAVHDVLQVVLLARVLHEHVGGRLEPPGAHVHPVLRVGLRVLNRHRVFHR